MCACVRVIFKKAFRNSRSRSPAFFAWAFSAGAAKIYIIWKGIFAEPKIRGFWGLRFFRTRGIFLGPDSGVPEMRFPWRTGLHSDDIDNLISAWTRGQTHSRCDARETPEPAGADGTGRVGTTSHNPCRVIGKGERTHAEMWYNVVYIDTA